MIGSKSNMAANFCFNFKISEKSSDFLTKEQPTELEEVERPSKTKAEFLTPSQDDLEFIFKESYEAQSVEFKGLQSEPIVPSFRLTHLSESYVETLMQNSEDYSSSATVQALNSNTDLIPSVYEGGMKIWECSIDLVNYLNKIFLEKKIDFRGKNVLELGCGAGLPGIYAWKKEANVCFQDYNEEVLKLFTIPNLALNLHSENRSDISKNPKVLESIQHCKFLSGDWESAMSIIEPMSFDVILTSETVYNIEAQKTLYELIKFSLKTSGVVFVAAKSYYFGVGGGTDQFAELVKKDNVFDISRVGMFSEGVKREILAMERKQWCI